MGISCGHGSSDDRWCKDPDLACVAAARATLFCAPPEQASSGALRLRPARSMRRGAAFLSLLGVALLGPLWNVTSGANAQDQPLDEAAIAQGLGKSGRSMPGGVYRVGFPRTDLHVSIGGLELRPTFALGGYAAFKQEGKSTLAVGDLVLLETEIPAVMNKLESSGFTITALHNHLRGETPHVMYMHFMGVGSAGTLASSLRGALEGSATPLTVTAAQSSAPEVAPEYAEYIQELANLKGTYASGVLSFSVPRNQPVTMQGFAIPPAMGVTNAINVQAADDGNVASTGDFVLIESEVNAVDRSLRAHGFSVTALHHHMLGDEPRLYYMHFYVVGTPQVVAEGLKDALSHINVVGP